LSHQCRGRAYELHASQMVLMWSLWNLGDVKRFGAEVQALAAEGKRRGDIFLATDFAGGVMNGAWLLGDDVDGARQHAEESSSRWSPAGYQLQHYWSMLANVHIALYTERPQDAWQLLTAEWKRLAGAMPRRITQVRIETEFLRGRCGLAAAAHDIDHTQALRSVVQSARALRRMGEPASEPLAMLLAAGLAAARGEHEPAAATFLEAARCCDERDMKLFAIIARRRAGALLGGSEGEAMVEEADAWMTGEGVARPDRLAAVWMPGGAGDD